MKRIGIAINPHKDKDGKIFEVLKEKLNKEFNGVTVIGLNSFELNRSVEDLKLDSIMVLGGDGTLLGIAREVSYYLDIPIIGINIGNLGFLSSTEIADLDIAIKKLKEKKYIIEKRMMLKCTACGLIIDEDIRALNDIVIARGTLSRMAKFKIYVGDKFYSSFKGDGLIVATPTGSTAYSFSAGGPFIYPDLNVMLLTPICPHTKSMQTMVVSGESEIIIEVCSEEETYLTTDGQKVYKMDNKSILRISRAYNEAKFIQFDDYDYFKVLRTKILNN